MNPTPATPNQRGAVHLQAPNVSVCSVNKTSDQEGTGWTESRSFVQGKCKGDAQHSGLGLESEEFPPVPPVARQDVKSGLAGKVCSLDSSTTTALVK